MESLLDVVHAVKLFPGKEFDIEGFRGFATLLESLGDDAVLASHVAVAGSLFVHGLAELEGAFDGGGTQIEEGFDFFGNLAIAQRKEQLP